ncbi:MAG: hypothetical protein ACREHF_14425 [Rhizomicrobium sp.]
MKNATRRLTFTLVFATVLVPCIAFAGVHPGHGCSNATFYGGYGMKLTGTWPQGAIVDVGRAVADGAGNVSGIDTISLGGAIYADTPFTGTYSVDSTCTLTATLNATGLPTVTLNGVIIDGGNGIFMVETDTGTSVSGTATATDVH